MQPLNKAKSVWPVALAVTCAFLAFEDQSLAHAQEQSWQDTTPGKSPYIFTQQHNINGRSDVSGRVQLVRLGWPLQVQLPGNPAVWTFSDQDSKLIEPLGHAMVYSPGRIDDTHSIYVFDFALPPDAQAGDTGRITLTTEERPQSLDKVIPTGVFSVDFLVIDTD